MSIQHAFFLLMVRVRLAWMLHVSSSGFPEGPSLLETLGPGPDNASSPWPQQRGPSTLGGGPTFEPDGRSPFREERSQPISSQTGAFEPPPFGQQHTRPA